MSGITEEQKLVKLGLRSPNQTESAVAGIIAQLQTNIANEWETFQELFEDENLSSWDAFETWLVDNGFDQDSAENVRTTLEEKYESFSEFKNAIISEYESWTDFENDFASNDGLRGDRDTTGGLTATGVTVYNEAGVGRSGQKIPAGGIEVFGTEVHFSESDELKDTPDDSAGTDDPVEWSNLVVDPTPASIGEDVSVTADITNNASYLRFITAELVVENEVRKSKTVEVSGKSTKTVSFTHTAGVDVTYASSSYRVGISKAGAEELLVTFPPIQ